MRSGMSFFCVVCLLIAPDVRAADVAATVPAIMSTFNGVAADGDLNNDGNDDLLTLGVQESQFGVVITLGGASFDSVADFFLPAFPMPPLVDLPTFWGEPLDWVDVNGDGFDDVLVSAHYGPTDPLGHVHLYLGPNPGAAPDLTLLPEDDDDFFGAWASGAGDVDNDGYEDVLVGAPFWPGGGQPVQGRFYLYRGGNPMDATPDLVVTGSGTGLRVGPAGDVNNDGFDDFMVLRDGVLDVFFGAPLDSLDSVPEWSIPLPGAFTLSSPGNLVASAADFNGDTFSDVIIGSPQEIVVNPIPTGKAFIYLGGTNPDVVADFTLSGEGFVSGFGSTVGSLRDANCDGFNDVFVGAPDFIDASHTSAGRAYIYYGGPGADQLADFWVTGPATNSRVGYGMAAGDLNNDSGDELIVSFFESNPPHNGIYNVYRGGTFKACAGDPTNVLEVPGLRTHLVTCAPNPINPATNIVYEIGEPGGSVRITLYDVAGRHVAELFNGTRTPGRHAVRWDGRLQTGARAASGIYVCRLESTGTTATMKVVVTR